MLSAVLRRVLPLLGLPCLLGLAFLLWYGLQSAEPFLGHDESVYAAKARSWLTDLPPAQWDPRRAPGVPALGTAALAIHDSVGAVRVIGLLLVLLTVTITYVVAARLTTPPRAAVCVLVVLTGAPFIRRVPEFLSDIAAAGLLVACAYLVIRRRLLVLALVALATFYLRYGATAGLLAIILAALVIWGPKAWLADKRRLALAAGVLGAVLMAVGLIAAVVQRRTKWKAFLGLSAVLMIVLLGLVGHGEPRFVYFSVIALVLLGVDALGSRWRPVLAVIAVVAVAQLPFAYLNVRDNAIAGVMADRRSLVAVADHFQRPCVVVTSYQPEIGWYSGCATMGFGQAKQEPTVGGLSFVLFERGRSQPAASTIRELAGDRSVTVEEFPARGALGRVWILTVGG